MFAYLFGMKRQDNAFRAIGDTAFLRRSLSHAKKTEPSLLLSQTPALFLM